MIGMDAGGQNKMECWKRKKLKVDTNNEMFKVDVNKRGC